jgi:hypothetical protein
LLLAAVDDAFGFEYSEEIDGRFLIVCAHGVVALGVDDDRWKVAALLIEEALAVGPIGGVGHVVDHLPVQGSPDADSGDRDELSELLLGELLPVCAICDGKIRYYPPNDVAPITRAEPGHI